jgi:hypothetical protein
MRPTERRAVLRYFFSNEVTVTPVDNLIDEVLDQMKAKGSESSDYPLMMTHLERLYELKAKDRQEPVSRDTIALIVGNLIGIILIVAYEQKHVMTSKAKDMIIRPR